MTASMSNPYAIQYNSAAKTIRVTRLHFIENQCMMLALLVAWARQITWAIGDDRSLLFANDESVKTTSCKVFWLSLT